MKSYACLFMLIVGIIISFIVFGKDLSDNDEKGKILIGKEDSIVGIWESTKCDKKDSNDIIQSAIQFNEDGSCAYATVSDTSSNSAKIEQKSDGTCYFNKTKNKIKMVKDDKIIINWSDYKNNKLIIENCELSKKVK